MIRKIHRVVALAASTLLILGALSCIPQSRQSPISANPFSSPDGKFLVYSADQPRFEIFMFEVGAKGEPKKLLPENFPDREKARLLRVEWSPDSKKTAIQFYRKAWESEAPEREPNNEVLLADVSSGSSASLSAEMRKVITADLVSNSQYPELLQKRQLCTYAAHFLPDGSVKFSWDIAGSVPDKRSYSAVFWPKQGNSSSNRMEFDFPTRDGVKKIAKFYGVVGGQVALLQ